MKIGESSKIFNHAFANGAFVLSPLMLGIVAAICYVRFHCMLVPGILLLVSFVWLGRESTQRRLPHATHSDIDVNALATVTHDLCAPASVISIRAQCLLRRIEDGQPPDPRELVKELGLIYSSTMKIGAQLNAMLDVARMHSGQSLDLQREPVDLVALVQQAVAEARTPENHIEIEAGAAVIAGKWDACRLDRAMANLLSNAVKYSPPQSPITVRVFTARSLRCGPQAVVQVMDRGIGIPAADLPFICERFHRGSNVTSCIAGTGLGLYGTRHIVRQHGGTIDLVSTEGAGTVVSIRLPL